MFRASPLQHLPFGFIFLVALLPFAAVPGCAQTSFFSVADTLASAPHPCFVSFNSPAIALTQQQGDDQSDRKSDNPATPTTPPETPTLTMFPHSEDSHYWVDRRSASCRERVEI